MGKGTYSEVLGRIHAAIEAAKPIFERFTPGEVETEYKSGHDPVTEADRLLDAALRKSLLRDGEGWLSEESADDQSRLFKSRVWVVDPLDGTREFVAGIPEFCTSIALVERGKPVAGGIYNPATQETFVGAIDSGLTYNGSPARASQRDSLKHATVLASRSEVNRGEWKEFENAPFKTEPMGSVAYKLARVAAGLADITFTLVPKHEWDVAGGAALVLSGGGRVRTKWKNELACNRQHPKLGGLIACGPLLQDQLMSYLAPHIKPVE